MKLEKFLQLQRFKKTMPYLKGNVLDFGGNKAELKRWVSGTYTLTNTTQEIFDMNDRFDVVVALAVIEHIETNIVQAIFKKFKTLLKAEGCILLTTPSPAARPLLEMLASSGLLDKENIDEHKHYWKKKEIFELAESSGFMVAKYQRFEMGLNQFARLTHKNQPD